MQTPLSQKVLQLVQFQELRDNYVCSWAQHSLVKPVGLIQLSWFIFMATKEWCLMSYSLILKGKKSLCFIMFVRFTIISLHPIWSIIPKLNKFSRIGAWSQSWHENISLLEIRRIVEECLGLSMSHGTEDSAYLLSILRGRVTPTNCSLCYS